MILLKTDTKSLPSCQYEICLTRTKKPEADASVTKQARKMMGTWIATNLTLGSFSLPAKSLTQDYRLVIDEYGCVRLGYALFYLELSDSGFSETADPANCCMLLQPDSPELSTLELYWTKNAITIIDPVSGAQLDFITSAESYWRDLCGTWRIESIYLTNIGVFEYCADMGFTLTLKENDTAVMTFGDQKECFSVSPTGDLDCYDLQSAGESYQATYSAFPRSIITICNEDKAIELTFYRPTGE